jgi:hypothetical protein
MPLKIVSTDSGIWQTLLDICCFIEQTMKFLNRRRQPQNKVLAGW